MLVCGVYFYQPLGCPDPVLVSVSVYTGRTLQCTLCIHCSGSSVAPVYVYTGSLGASVYTYTGATLAPLQCIHSVHCSVCPVYTLIDTSTGSGYFSDKKPHVSELFLRTKLSCCTPMPSNIRKRPPPPPRILLTVAYFLPLQFVTVCSISRSVGVQSF